jgi:hypothetical protein
MVPVEGKKWESGKVAEEGCEATAGQANLKGEGCRLLDYWTVGSEKKVISVIGDR